jgi:hypothetical protein
MDLYADSATAVALVERGDACLNCTGTRCDFCCDCCCSCCFQPCAIAQMDAQVQPMGGGKYGHTTLSAYLVPPKAQPESEYKLMEFDDDDAAVDMM